MTVPWPTVLGIPAPRKGEEADERPLRYRAWFWLYKTVRVTRHRFGRCDWRTISAYPGPRFDKCDWCGATRKVQP